MAGLDFSASFPTGLRSRDRFIEYGSISTDKQWSSNFGAGCATTSHTCSAASRLSRAFAPSASRGGEWSTERGAPAPPPQGANLAAFGFRSCAGGSGNAAFPPCLPTTSVILPQKWNRTGVCARPVCWPSVISSRAPVAPTTARRSPWLPGAGRALPPLQSQRFPQCPDAPTASCRRTCSTGSPL